MYLEIDEPVKAFEAYQASLKTHPNRYSGLYGAGLSAENSGNLNSATLYYKKLLLTASNSNRPELEHAKLFLTTRLHKNDKF